MYLYSEVNAIVRKKFASYKFPTIIGETLTETFYGNTVYGITNGVDIDPVTVCFVFTTLKITGCYIRDRVFSGAWVVPWAFFFVT